MAKPPANKSMMIIEIEITKKLAILIILVTKNVAKHLVQIEFKQDLDSLQRAYSLALLE